MNLPIRIRALNWDDRREVNYVRSSWLGSAKFGPMGPDLGYDWDGYARVRDKLMQASGVRVACSENNTATIVGWACVDEDAATVHYVYVREEFRRYGVARALLGEVGKMKRVWYTARTDDSARIALPESWRWSFYRAVA